MVREETDHPLAGDLHRGVGGKRAAQQCGDGGIAGLALGGEDGKKAEAPTGKACNPDDFERGHVRVSVL